MKRFVFMTLVICLFAACVGYWPYGTVYLSPPPDVAYDAAVVIVKDMGFTITYDS